MEVYFIENEHLGRNSSGGVMTYLLNLVPYLKSNNVSINWIATGSPDNADINVIPISNKPISNLKYLVLLFKIRNQIPSTPDVIIHSQRLDFLLPFILFKGKNKLLCTLHGRRDLCFAMKKGIVFGYFYKLVNRICSHKADLLISVDSQSTFSYQVDYDIAPQKMVTIPIGVDFKKYFPMDKFVSREKLLLEKDDKYLLYIGRLEYEKNLFFLLESFKSISDINRNCHLLVIGSGSYLNKLKNYQNTKDIQNVTFLEEKSNAEIPLWINASDLLVLCSLREGSPTVVREALACNVPVLSSDVGDVKEILGQFGKEYLSELKAEVYASKIEHLLHMQHPDFRKQLSRYSSEYMGEKTLECYKRLQNS